MDDSQDALSALRHMSNRGLAFHMLRYVTFESSRISLQPWGSSISYTATAIWIAKSATTTFHVATEWHDQLQLQKCFSTGLKTEAVTYQKHQRHDGEHFPPAGMHFSNGHGVLLSQEARAA